MPTRYSHHPTPGSALVGVACRPRAGVQPPPLPPRGPLIYWPAVCAAAGVCVVLLAGLAVVLACIPADRNTPAPPPAEAVAVADVEPPAPPESPAVFSPPPISEPAKEEEVAPSSPGTPTAEAPTPAPPAKEKAACRPPTALLGTAVEFVDNPEAAARTAARENKLLYVLHVSGNFEDPGFT